MLSKKDNSGLKKLVLRKAAKVTYNGWEGFFSRELKSLRHLNLEECFGLIDETLLLISESCPNLEIFRCNWSS